MRVRLWRASASPPLSSSCRRIQTLTSRFIDDDGKQEEPTSRGQKKNKYMNVVVTLWTCKCDVISPTIAFVSTFNYFVWVERDDLCKVLARVCVFVCYCDDYGAYCFSLFILRIVHFLSSFSFIIISLTLSVINNFCEWYDKNAFRAPVAT